MKPTITNFVTEDDPAALLADGPNESLTNDLAETGVNTVPRENDLIVDLPGHYALCVRSATTIKESGTLTPEQAAAVDGLLYVVRTGVGVDNLDIKALASLGIIVMNTPKATTKSVGEHTVGLVFDLFKRLSVQSLRTQTEFKKERTEELGGKKVLIIGAGNIGKDAGARMHALGMNVTFYDPYAKKGWLRPNGPDGVNMLETDEDSASTLPVARHEGDLPQLLKEADVISIHVPGGNILRDEEFDAIEEGGNRPYIINTSRAEVIDTERALTMLEEGKLRGLGLDVLPDEKEYESSPVGETVRDLKQRLFNIAVTGHSAGNSAEGQANTGHEAAEYIDQIRRGKMDGFGVKIEEEIPEGSIRVTAVINNVTGAMEKILKAISEKGWNADAVATNTKGKGIFGGGEGTDTDIVAWDIRNGGTDLEAFSREIQKAIEEIEESPILRVIIAKKD